MSGRRTSFFALGLAFCLGLNGAYLVNAQSADSATAGQVLELEILKPPPPFKEGETVTPEAAIRRALDARVRVTFVDAPLQDICEAIGKKLGIPVAIDSKALSDEGLDTDLALSRSMNNVRLRSHLDLILADHDLQWTIRSEVLLITTTTQAQKLLETRVYDVADLVTVPEYGYADFDSLIELITNIISPETWSDVGGEGSIEAVEAREIQTIVISQPLRIHYRIEELLADLRTHIPKKTQNERDEVNFLDNKVLAGEETVRRALKKKVDLDFNETPLDEVVEHLAEILKIEIQLHEKSLSDEGLDPQTPISFRTSGVSAEAAMDRMLGDLDLAYIIEDNFILILTATQEHETLNFKVYDVSDLAGVGVPFEVSLIDSITNTISPESWVEVGGEGAIGAFENAGMCVIVVSQTLRVHAGIEKLLADLRKFLRKVDVGPSARSGLNALGSDMGSETPGPGPSSFRSFRGSGSATNVPDIPESEQRFSCSRSRRALSSKEYPDLYTLVQSNNHFAFDLYAKLREDNKGKNLFFSPTSIATAMAMIHAGARNETAGEIARAMHFTLPPPRLHPACRSLLGVLHEGRAYKLSVANRLWIQNGYVLLDHFKDVTRNYYGAECDLVDFAGNREAAARKINAWIEQQTNRRIRGLIGPGTLEDDTVMVLANAVYFKGQWDDPFEVSDTKPGPFFAEDGQKQVNMMSMEDRRCRYAKIEDAGLQVLEKPYDPWHELTMLILLPKQEPGSLDRLEATLSEEKLSTWRRALSPQTVKIHLPKFRLETGYSLEKQLMELGIHSAFNSGPVAADFSGIDGTHGLYLQFVIHKAFVDVDEQGTEAAAATTGGLGGGMMPSEPAEFRADHPFVFLIRDNLTGSILFLGRYCNPESCQTTRQDQNVGMF